MIQHSIAANSEGIMIVKNWKINIQVNVFFLFIISSLIVIPPAKSLAGGKKIQRISEKALFLHTKAYKRQNTIREYLCCVYRNKHRKLSKDRKLFEKGHDTGFLKIKNKRILKLFFSSTEPQTFIDTLPLSTSISLYEKGALKIPNQTKPWSCGLNSAARAIMLINNDLNFCYNTWVKESPRYINETIMSKKMQKIGFGTFCLSNLLGGFFFFKLGGMSFLFASAFGTLGFSIGLVGLIINNKKLKEKLTVGPCPLHLVSYINNYLCNKSEYKAKFHTFRNFKYFSHYIVTCLKLGFPVIVLMIYGPQSMHYLNIVGIEYDHEGNIKEYIVLDTDGEFYQYDHVVFNYWSKNTLMAGAFLFNLLKRGHAKLEKYNLITIFKDI